MVTNSRTTLRTHRLRPLNLPQPIDVELNRHDLPIAVTRNGKHKMVDTIGETWKVTDEWWRDRIARRYVEVILEGGERIVMYEDIVADGWFVHQEGRYDVMTC